MELFQYNLQISRRRKLGKETLKTLLLKGIQDKYLEILNLMGAGDVFQLLYDDVCELCIRYSRGNFKNGKNSKEPSSRFLKFAAKLGALGAEIGNLFENFNANINGSLNSQLGVLQVKERNEEFEEIVFPRFQKKHIAMDCPLDSLTICGICDLNHSTYFFPSLPSVGST